MKVAVLPITVFKVMRVNGTPPIFYILAEAKQKGLRGKHEAHLRRTFDKKKTL